MPRPRVVLVLVLSWVLTAAAATPAAAQRQRVFVRSRAAVVEIRTDPARLGDVINTWAIPTDTAYSPQARVVGAGRYLLLETSSDETVVLDTITGAVIRANVSNVIGVIGDGRELVTFTFTSTGQPLLDVVTTATQARRRIDLPASCIREVAVAEQARALVVLRAERCVLNEPPVQWIDVVSLDGAPTRERVVGVTATFSQRHITTNAEGTHLWVTTPSEGISLFDLAAIVTGRSVTLTWQPSPEATHYEIEGALVRELRNLARYVTGDTSFTPPDVPPGTYHVRVRALNYAGKGAYTHDLVITVP